MQPSAKNGFTIYTLCLLLAVVALLCACSRHSERLRAADAVMEDDPASALQMLDSIDTATLTDGDRPYYCLLYTQAQVKNGIAVDNDSLIAVAYDAYAHASGNSDLKKRANFYNAKVAYNARDYKKAMRDILTAYEIARTKKDPYWSAKAAEIIADIYYDAYNYGQAAIYTRIAADYYLKAGRVTSHRYALCDLGSTLANGNKGKEGSALLDSLFGVIVAEHPLDTLLYEYVKLPMISVLYRSGRTDDLQKILNEGYRQNLPDDLKVDLDLLISDIMNSNGKVSESNTLLEQAEKIAADDQERIRVLYSKYKRALKSNEYEKAANFGDSLLRMQTSITSALLSESVAGVERDYYAVCMADEKRNSTIKNYALACAILVLISVSLSLIIIHRQKIKNKNTEIDAILSSLTMYKDAALESEEKNKLLESEISAKNNELNIKETQLKNKDIELENKNIQLKEKEQELSQKNSELVEMFREQWTVLNTFCNEYFNKSENSELRESIIKETRLQIEKITSPDNLKKIEDAVIKYMGNMMNLLKEECPWIKPQDYKFILLICAGFSVRAVCLLVNIKKPQYYQKRERLCNRFIDCDVPHKDFFIENIKSNQK